MATAEARELSLIDKVELRIALADSDAKLQSLLNTYLTPLLLKLASESSNVRNKVITVCHHVNTRIKPPTIQLPVASLLKQFKENSAVPLIRHFDLSYAQQGFARLSSGERADLFPTLASGVAGAVQASAEHGAIWFNLFLRSLRDFTLPPRGGTEDAALRGSLGISDEDAKTISFWVGKLILMDFSGEKTTQHYASTGCPGVSGEQFSFLTLGGKPETWDQRAGNMSITEARLKALKLLSSGLFTHQERLLPSIFASGDYNSRVATEGQDVLKQCLAKYTPNDDDTVAELCSIYMGESMGVQGNLSELITAKRIPPVGPLVKIKILSLLANYITSAEYADFIIKVVATDLVIEQSEGLEAVKEDRQTFKLRSQIVMFLNSIVRKAPQDLLRRIAIPVIKGLQGFLDQYFEGHISPDQRKIQGACYECVGLIAASYEEALVQPDLKLLRWLFQSAREVTDKGVLVSIDEALSSTIQSFRGSLEKDITANLRMFLLDNMNDTGPNARNVKYAAVRFANRCLPFDDEVARWIDIVAASQPSEGNHELVEEGINGLDPHLHRLSSISDLTGSGGTKEMKVVLPPFSKMVQFAFQARKTTARHSSNYVYALSFCRQCLFWEALAAEDKAPQLSLDWARKLDLAISEDRDSRKAIRSYFKNQAQDEEFSHSMSIMWQEALEGSTVEQQSACLPSVNLLAELCSLWDKTLISRHGAQALLLRSAIFSNNVEIRQAAGPVFGLLAIQQSIGKDSLLGFIQDLLSLVAAWKGSSGAESNRIHGAMLALSYYFAYSAYHSPKQGNSQMGEMLVGYQQIVVEIITHGSSSLLCEGASQSLAQLSAYFAVDAESLCQEETFDSVSQKLEKRAQEGNEKAALAIGSFSMIFEESKKNTEIKTLTDALFKLHELRQVESQFTIGEALTYVAFSWESTALSSRLPFDGQPPSGPSRSAISETIVERVLDACNNTKPALRKAAAIWALCLIQFGGSCNEIQQQLRKFQIVFKKCLSDRDELVQESASRGLGLIYERGDKDLKDDLVRDLIGSFSSSRANLSGTVTEDTQLFEPGALPTGDGSVTTYKDIMSLASEVGDSSLVYRFMSLASNNAIWSSRAAFGRFGLSNVFSDASINEYLAENPKLIPKLYRYRFDPNSNVRRSMNDIWNALIKDSAGTIDTNFERMLEDLLESILGREWRVREASCAAIADLIQGRNVDRLQPFLDRLWVAAYKVLDDIKESVRAAAAGLARTMTGILLRCLESETHVQTTNMMLKSVLPFLLSPSGLESSSKDIQAASIRTLLEIIKKARAQTLRPFIPELVENLLGLLTSFEPEAVNYIHLNASKYNVTEQQIDDMRLSSVRSSPIMEAIERCIDVLDDTTMKALVQKLQQAIKAAVGMPSKVGCSRVIVSLATRKSFLFGPYSDQILGFIPKFVKDRNETVSTSYAAALGYVARSSSDDSILKLVDQAKRMYFDSDDDRSRISSGEVVQAVAKQATDRFNALASVFLPFVFIARHDENASVRQGFQDVWSENVGGSRATSLYLTEIVDLASQHLGSRKWNLKHAAALALSDAAKGVSSAKGEISAAEADILWPALKRALAEKSWDGKEKVLDGFVEFVKKGPKYRQARPDVVADIRQIALREARRRNADYQQYAVAALAQVAGATPETDMFDEVYGIVEPIIESMTNSAEKGAGKRENAVEEGVSEATRAARLVAALDALFQSLPLLATPESKQLAPDVDEQAEDKIMTRVRNILDLAAKISADGQPFSVHEAYLVNCKRLFGRLSTLPGIAARMRQGEALATAGDENTIIPALPDDRTSLPREALRLLRSEALLCLAELIKYSPRRATLHSTLAAALDVEPSAAVRTNLLHASQLLGV